MTPKISVCVLNWNGLHHLRECLPTVMGQSCSDFEVIVVDNGSTDGSVGYLEELRPRLQLIRNAANRGFCGGANQAITQAQGDYVLLLNNDTVLDPGCIAELLEAWNKADANVIAIFPKVLSYEHPELINTFGARWDRWRLWVDIGRNERSANHDTASRVFGAYFVAPCFRRLALRDIGLFDETFFAQVEDFDVCYRANLLGYVLCRWPKAIVYHKEHGSKRDNRVDDLRFLRRLGVRNLLVMVLKNYEARNLIIYFPWVLVSKWGRSLIGSVYYNGLRTVFASLATHTLILGEVVRLLPHIRECRRRLQPRRMLKDCEIWRL